MTAIDTARRAVDIARALPASLRRTMLTAITSGDGGLHLLDCPPSVLSDLGTHGLAEYEPAPLTDLGRLVYAVLIHGADRVLAHTEESDRPGGMPLPTGRAPVSQAQAEIDRPEAAGIPGHRDCTAEPGSSHKAGTAAKNTAGHLHLAVVEDMTHRGQQEVDVDLLESVLVDHVGKHATEEIFAAYDAAVEASRD